MERADWLKKMRQMSETIYDHFSPEYWVRYGTYNDQTHLEFLQKFLARFNKKGTILSAACGAGRFDGVLLAAGHSVVGIDQSAGMLARAREHFPQDQYPQLRYERVGLQEIGLRPDFHEAFEGAICIDAMEHICPEDWPGIIQGLGQALKPGGALYFTAERPEPEEVEASYRRSMAIGLPVLYGEVADRVEESYEQILALKPAEVPDDLADGSVYHYYPPFPQMYAWITQAGLTVEEEGDGHWYHHIIASKRS